LKNDIFINLLRNKIDQRKINRIILNKYHLIITAASYRSIIYQFKKILNLEVQTVFLTSTLSINQESQLINELNLKSFAKIRADCLRTNISYRALPFRSNKLDLKFKEVKEYCFKMKSSFKSYLDKIIIFCPSIALVDQLSEYLNCTKFTSELNNLQKQSVLSTFVNNFTSYNNILVCTNSLQEGFDYSNIRLTIYFEFAFDFIGFLQGFSRAGRDKNPAISMFFYNLNSEKEADNDSFDRSLIKSYWRESVCRKRLISLYLNNTILDQCSNSTNKCDLCIIRSNIYRQQALVINSITQEVEKSRTDLIWLISQDEFCIFCFLLYKENNTSHVLRNCKDFNNLYNFAKDIKKIFI
jgi:superfamily II DNA helicase RecQ